MDTRQGSIASLAWLLLLLLAVGATFAQDAAAGGEAWLGVYLVDEVDGGIRIVALVPGGPAALAGLRKGDLLLTAGGVDLADQDALASVLGAGSVGRPLDVELLRDGKPLSLQVTPLSRAGLPRLSARVPESPQAPRRAPVAWWSSRSGNLGLEVVPTTPELRRHYGAAPDRGVLVVRAEPQGPGGRAGIQVGDVVVALGDSIVTRPAELELGVLRWDRKAPLTLGLVRGGKPLQVELAVVEPTPPSPDPVARRRMLEQRILLLEQQIQTLKRQLEELSEPAATPDR